MASPTDLGHQWTESELAALERRIAQVYSEASAELQERIEEYFRLLEQRDKQMRQLMEQGKITKDQYTQWRLNQIGRGERFEALRDELAERVTQANEVAVSYVNDATPGVYSLNRNYAAYTIELVTGDIGFTLFDEATVRRLITERPDLMPYYPARRALKRGIDLAYGREQITAAITSSILQGKSIGQIADDLQSRIVGMGRTSAVRAARTAMTGAQNGGRADSYARARQMGIKLRKEWVATLDERTRHSHRRLDGEIVDDGKRFSNGLMYPGDSSGRPEEIYNCRCTMIAQVEGVDTSDAMRRDRYGVLPDMTYAQWERQKRGGGYLQK